MKIFGKLNLGQRSGVGKNGSNQSATRGQAKLSDLINGNSGNRNKITINLRIDIEQILAAARGFRNFASYRCRILFYCGKLDLKPTL